MTRREKHDELVAQCETLNGKMTKLIEELDREPLDEPTQVRIAKALNGGH